ncbi:hypothetical protein POM88_054875 [Heracleum sosnowskyi]|uniref:Translation initiation factor IF- 2 domain-containing protein n=1 Tax=Heracleum sosnowskyi TaxID=360622 RepID=A0AAD8GMP6_9APIA|nr:hypothetical protein POM88_054875 [Heracleum sosnowskyi]
MLSACRKKIYEKDRLMKINENKAVSPELSEDADVPERVEMRVIVKADVQGSVQAVTDALKSLNSSQGRNWGPKGAPVLLNSTAKSRSGGLPEASRSFMFVFSVERGIALDVMNDDNSDNKPYIS